MFDPDFPISDLRGADYNPRHITQDDMERLKQSVQTLGIVKPIITTKDGLIIAGHQRTKALRSINVKTAPVFMLDNISIQDEIRFNQLHNGTDLDGDALVTIPAGKATGQFEDVTEISGDLRSPLAATRQAICRLIQKYGAWGAAVADESGNVIHAAQYALSCKVLGIPCRIYRVNDPAKALPFLNAEYGVFSYEHLQRTTYAQTLAQLKRLRGGVRDNRSTLYEKLVIPDLKGGDRVLDFGCGYGDYVKRLKKDGINILGLEFFRKGHKVHAIDPKAVHAMCHALFRNIQKYGLFDVVLCDSVLNSTDRIEAENDVMTCLNAFCKNGGYVYFSGRRRDFVEGAYRAREQKNFLRRMEFLDKNGFSAIFREGVWTYQKYHTAEEAQELGARFIGHNPEYTHAHSSTSWQVKCQKTHTLPEGQIISALRREFDLPWPNGKRVGLANQAEEAWKNKLRA